MITKPLVTCKKYGWVHFTMSREYAEREVEKFNEYYDTLPKGDQQDFYGGKKSSIALYDRCFFCGGSYKNFRPYKEGDCPAGCAIQPIIKTED